MAIIEKDIYQRKVSLPRGFFELPDHQREYLKNGIDEIKDLKEVLFKPITMHQFEESTAYLFENSANISRIVKDHQRNGLETGGQKLQSCIEKANTFLVSNGYLSAVLTDIKNYGEQLAQETARENLEDTFGIINKPHLPGAICDLSYYAGNHICWKLIEKEEGYTENPFSYIMDLYRNGVVTFGFADSIENKTDYLIAYSLIKDKSDNIKAGEFVYEKTEGEQAKASYSLKDLSALKRNDIKGFPLPDLTRPITHQKNQG